MIYQDVIGSIGKGRRILNPKVFETSCQSSGAVSATDTPTEPFPALVPMSCMLFNNIFQKE